MTMVTRLGLEDDGGDEAARAPSSLGREDGRGASTLPGRGAAAGGDGSQQCVENPLQALIVLAGEQPPLSHAASKSGQRLQLIALEMSRIRSALAFWERHSEEGEHRELPRMTLSQPWGAGGGFSELP